MFNIRNLVNRIAQGKDGDSETSSIRSRTLSQASSVVADEGIPIEAEGFLCPTCMAAFPSADSLQAHYEKEHLEPGANYLCPVCKARLDNAAELEQHYSAQHSTSATRAKGDLDVLMQEINSLTSSLNEERWGSEELRKEVSMMKEMLKVHGSGEEHQMYQQQIQGLSETKSLLTSEVVLLRKQLAEALETTLNLKQERDKLEEKAARNSQTVAQLQASLDENTGLVAALKEDIKSLESTIEHNRPSVDDAEVLKKELASVQRLMNELTVAKETELGDLKKELFDLQLEYEALKEKYSRNDQDTSADVPSLEVENRMQQLESDRHHLIENLEIQKEEANEARRILAEKNEQLLSMQRIRDETDVCVGQLRQEVTSLQEMLNQARHQAEGQVSAKECELMQFKLDLSKHQQQVDNLEKQCQSLRQTNDQLTNSVSQKEAEIKELQLSLKQLSDTSHQLEEKTARLEEDKAELLLTIEKGEGADTAIQQLQQDNARLQDELANCSIVIASLKSEQKVKTDEWTVLENQLKEEKTKFQDVINNQSKDLEAARERNTHLEASVGEFSKEIEEHKMKYVLLESKIKEKEKIELEQERKVQEKDRELAQLEASLKSARADIAQKDDVANQLTCQLELTKGRVEKIEGVLKDRENEVNQLTAARQQDAKELDQAQTRLADKVRVISELEERVKQLEPLTEAVEQEKLRRIKEKAEWNEHEQLLRGEKESLATLSTHLQQQVEEQATEHRIHLQRLKSESEALLKDKNQLIEQLNGLKDTRTKENNDWLEKQIRFEEELKSLRSSLSAAEDLSATRYQRCEDLQASAEKYHSLKIELETRLALLEEEKIELQNNCSQWENEVDRLKFNAAELRRRLEDSQAALHELGRENQSLQMENAKLQGRKWADDSEVNDCHSCQKGFNLTVRKHHCRNCGQIFCNECSSKSTAVGNSRKPVRVCDSCFKELTINSPR